MSVVIEDLPQRGGFFKAEEYVDYDAVLIEIRKIELQRSGGSFGPKDAIHGDVTAFAAEDLADPANASPHEVKGTIIQQTVLVSDLKLLGEGKATVARIGQSKPKAGQRPAWVLNRVDPRTKRAVVAYVEAREARVKEALANLDEEDSWLAD